MPTMELLDQEGRRLGKNRLGIQRRNILRTQCLPWHVLLPFGKAITTLMNMSARRKFSQHLFPFNQELFWRYFKRTYFENVFFLFWNMIKGSSKSFSFFPQCWGIKPRASSMFVKHSTWAMSPAHQIIFNLYDLRFYSLHFLMMYFSYLHQIKLRTPLNLLDNYSQAPL